MYKTTKKDLIEQQLWWQNEYQVLEMYEKSGILKKLDACRNNQTWICDDIAKGFLPFHFAEEIIDKLAKKIHRGGTYEDILKRYKIPKEAIPFLQEAIAFHDKQSNDFGDFPFSVCANRVTAKYYKEHDLFGLEQYVDKNSLSTQLDHDYYYSSDFVYDEWFLKVVSNILTDYEFNELSSDKHWLMFTNNGTEEVQWSVVFHRFPALETYTICLILFHKHAKKIKPIDVFFMERFQSYQFNGNMLGITRFIANITFIHSHTNRIVEVMMPKLIAAMRNSNWTKYFDMIGLPKAMRE